MSWGLTAAAAIGAGGSILGGYLGGGEQGYQDPKMLPGYAESEGAMAKWWETLQGQNADNMYGAISPDWADIWDQAQQKTKQYFWGSPTSPGQVGKIKSSAAARNVSDSPALGKMMGRMAIEENQVIGNQATNHAFQQAQFGENARMNWLSNLQGLSSLKPSYSQGYGTGYQAGPGDLVAGASGAASNALSTYNQQKWLEDMLKNPPTSGGDE